jgi:hypothetical protein
MARIVDRIRVLNDLGDKICRGEASFDYVAERLAHIREEMERLVWRSDRIRIALVTLYLAFGSFVCTSLALALDFWTGSRLFFALPTALAVVGVGLLLFACINLVREALAALRNNRIEIQFYRALHARRLAEGTGCPGLTAGASQASDV